MVTPAENQQTERDRPVVSAPTYGDVFFECGCAASNVEWVRDYDNPNKYIHMPHFLAGQRSCPRHNKPVARREARDDGGPSVGAGT